jgi:phage tail sheath protein FI
MVDILKAVADLCEDARIQIDVDQQMGIDSQKIKEFKVQLSGWVLLLREEILEMTIGRKANTSRVSLEGDIFSRETAALVAAMNS